MLLSAPPPRAAGRARIGVVVGCSVIGLWLGVDRSKIAKARHCTAWTAAYHFGGGLAVVARWGAGGLVQEALHDRLLHLVLVGPQDGAVAQVGQLVDAEVV